MKKVAIIYSTCSPVEYVLDPEDRDWELAETIVIGTNGNYTGRTPTEEEFKTAWELMA